MRKAVNRNTWNAIINRVNKIQDSNLSLNQSAVDEQLKQTNTSRKQFNRNKKQGMEGVLDPQFFSTNSLASKREKGDTLSEGIKFAANQKIAYVPSTAIQSVRRDPINNRTFIKYKNGTGKEYEFAQSDYQFDELMNADSKGRHVNSMRNDPTQNLNLQ